MGIEASDDDGTLATMIHKIRVGDTGGEIIFKELQRERRMSLESSNVRYMPTAQSAPRKCTTDPPIRDAKLIKKLHI